MFFKINKKAVFLIVFVLILVVAGVFYYKNREIKGSPDDYIIKETEQGTIVENKRAGLTMKVPDGWEIEKMEIMEGSMVFYTPDAEGYRLDRIKPPLKKGCIIETAIAYKKTDFEEIEKKSREAHKSLIMKFDEFEEIEINGRPALKNIFDSTDLGFSIEIYIPERNKLYGLRISAGTEDFERCSKEFDEFLKGVFIE